MDQSTHEVPRANRLKIVNQELEKQGTKLYSLSPIPFLLLLFSNQEGYVVEVSETSLSLDKNY